MSTSVTVIASAPPSGTWRTPVARMNCVKSVRRPRVSSTGKNRRSRAISCRAAASIARVGAGFRCWIPAASTRATGERESSPSFPASVHSPLAARARTSSGSRLRPRRHHVQARSMTTASARMEQAASGIMTGPPRASTVMTALTARLQRRDPTDDACLLRSLVATTRCDPGLGPRAIRWLAGSGREGFERAGYFVRISLSDFVMRRRYS
jgi:hypothetical protein